MKGRKLKKGVLAGVICGLAIVLIAGAVLLFLRGKRADKQPDMLLAQYMEYVRQGDYSSMYEMLDTESQKRVGKEEFLERHQNIYEGIEAENFQTEVSGTEKTGKTEITVSYHTEMDSVAGEISFDNQAVFVKDKEKGYALSWSDSIIFPQMTHSDKIRVSTDAAARGRVLDRNGKMLAGPGTASSVGLVPGKMSENPDADIEKLAGLLDVTAESIETKLGAAWVKDDSMVPIRNIEKLGDTELMTDEPSESAQQKSALLEELLGIPGVMVTDVSVRTYPYGEAASHLTGYVQNVTAEDLEEHEGEGYSSSSVIGRSGMEGLYEKELKGTDGKKISMVDEAGEEVYVLASVPKQDGEDITLTIDAKLQQLLYTQFAEDESCSVAMNPYTGEVLALVSTPSFDSNDFILGMSSEQWDLLNNDEKKPMYNRFRQTWCPGSSLKPVIASTGLTTGAFTAEEDFGRSGLSWQKDAGWGDYHVTTLHDYEPATLENALIYSDNIYFAKAALKIKAGSLMSEFDRLGFGKEIPFEIKMSQSQYANEGEIDTEIQLADSGYGQGEMLVNPLHMAALYTAFVNEGSVIKPCLRYQEDIQPETWIPQAFTRDAANTVKSALELVVNSPEGTGYAAHREDIRLAGKTGTAEIKASKEDQSGTELGWFAVFTAQADTQQPLLLVSMAEDVKERRGSTYVVEKDKAVLDAYLPFMS
ncbi:penicillin-binding transpeptidase domain-containing protein [Ruminococcus sp. OA3]|uniref:penicillin-binding transpeptidase domain-containing protein n=1 Tax=Ruminococcus sp. OA3 TaxID=2914164 RepID=UPI001F0711E6|nr:penicillin-binding transpeptidase domain-containing protein [Ruminococcus sp. OA3]MCH1984333.1 penicillin-binding transpeptidase domain-containing protein [Ruminococcus sp. OA3]